MVEIAQSSNLAAPIIGNGFVSAVPWERLKPGQSAFYTQSEISKFYNSATHMLGNLRPAASRKGKRYGYVFKVIYHEADGKLEIACVSESANGEKARAKNVGNKPEVEETEKEKYNRLMDEAWRKFPHANPSAPDAEVVYQQRLYVARGMGHPDPIRNPDPEPVVKRGLHEGW